MNENYHFYYVVPKTKNRRITYGEYAEFDEKNNRDYKRKEGERVWTLDQVINSVSFNSFGSISGSNKFKQKFFSNEFNDYLNKFLTYKNHDIVSLHSILFFEFPIFIKFNFAALNICDCLEYSDLFTLKMFRSKRGINNGTYHCVLLKSDLYQQPKTHYYYNLPFKFEYINSLNEFTSNIIYDVVLYNVNLIDFGRYDTEPDSNYELDLTINVNKLLYLLSILSSVLSNTGLLIINFRHTFSYISCDLLKYLSTIFNKVIVSKPISYHVNSFFFCITCENYIGDVNLPINNHTIYRLYDSYPHLTDFWNIYDDKLYKLRTEYVEKLEYIIHEHDLKHDISKYVNELQHHVLNTNIYIYNKLGFNIPLYIFFNKTYVNQFIKFYAYSIKLLVTKKYINFDMSQLEYIKIELFKYKMYLDSLNQVRYAEFTNNIKQSKFVKHLVFKEIGIKVSQAFLKMIEIIHEFNFIDKTNIKTLHICEAPGQFVMAFKYYCQKNGIIYDWVANSLNPNNKDNIKKYGGNIFSDVYGLMKSNPDKWIWGADQTGDITNIDNIKELTKNKYDVITSDCGLPTDEFGLQEDQMAFINLCQIIVILFGIRKNGNACFKTYLPCSKIITITLIHLIVESFENVYMFKPSLNPSSSEIYIVCMHFNYFNKHDFLLDLYYNHNKTLNVSHISDSYIYNINDLSIHNKSSIFRSMLLYYFLDSEDQYKKLVRNQKSFAQNWIRKYFI